MHRVFLEGRLEVLQVQSLPLSPVPERKHFDTRQPAAVVLLVYYPIYTGFYEEEFLAVELQRRLGHKNYMPIWEMVHKLRNAMGKWDAEYKVCELVVLDEGASLQK